MGGKNNVLKYEELARHAQQNLLPQGVVQGQVICEGNRLLWLFYREVYRDAQESDDVAGGAATNVWAQALNRSVASIQRTPYRIASLAELTKLKGMGSATIKPAEVLWKLYPPPPLNEEEQALLVAVQADQKEAETKKRIDAAAAKGASGVPSAGRGGGKKGGKVAAAAPPLLPALAHGASFSGAFTLHDLERITQEAARAAGLGTAPADNLGHDEDGGGGVDAGRRAARKPRAPKEYMPQVGTANYAFLVTLYLSAKSGVEYESKASLMQKAEASGLANRSLFNASGNQGMTAPGDRYYDGWSSLNKSLVNRTPPLVMAWSNPKKLKLTDDGMQLAAQLYKDAVARQKVQPLPGVDPDADIAAGRGGRAAAVSQTDPAVAPLPAPPHSAGKAVPGRGGQAAAAAAGGGAGPSVPPRRQASPPHSQARPARPRRPQDFISPSLMRGYYSGSASDSDAHPEAAAEWLELGGARALPDVLPGQFTSEQEDDDEALWEAMAASAAETGAKPSPRASSPPVKRPRFDENVNANSRPFGYVTAPASSPRGRLGALKMAHPAAAPMASPDVIVLTDSDEERGTARQTGSGRVLGQGQSTGAPARPAPSALPTSLSGGLGHLLGPASGGVTGSGQPRGAADAPPRAATGLTILPRISGAPAATRGPVLELGALAAMPPSGPPRVASRSAPAGVPAPLRVAGSASGRVAYDNRPAPPIMQRPPVPPANATAVGPSSGAAQRATAPRPPSGTSIGTSAPERTSSVGSQDSAGPVSGTAATAGQPYRWPVPRLSEPGPGLRLPPLPAGRSFLETYEVVLVLDQREQFGRSTAGGAAMDRTAAMELRAEQMRGQGILVHSCMLAIGDFVWVARSRAEPEVEYMMDTVMERKSCPDLILSIQGDGQRFSRQKWWLRHCGLAQVMYLIEGHPDRVALKPAEVKTVKTVAMGNELDGLRVLRTDNVNESVQLLVRYTKSLARAFESMSRAAGGGQAQGDADAQVELFKVWNDRIKRMRANDVRNVLDVWGCMLSAVPGLGPNSVDAITAAYPTPMALHAAYQAAVRKAKDEGRNPVAAAQHLLAGLQLASGAGRVGGRSKDVFEALFYEGSSLWKERHPVRAAVASGGMQPSGAAAPLALM